MTYLAFANKFAGGFRFAPYTLPFNSLGELTVRQRTDSILIAPLQSVDTSTTAVNCKCTHYDSHGDDLGEEAQGN